MFCVGFTCVPPLTLYVPPFLSSPSPSYPLLPSPSSSSSPPSFPSPLPLVSSSPSPSLPFSLSLSPLRCWCSQHVKGLQSSLIVSLTSRQVDCVCVCMCVRVRACTYVCVQVHVHWFLHLSLLSSLSSPLKKLLNSRFILCTDLWPLAVISVKKNGGG